MQIARLLEMVFLLLEKNTVTAKELSIRFEVSIRTIYRDVEALSIAGVPIYTIKGRNGGISLMPGFVLNKAILSQEEKGDILAVLQGFSAAKVPDSDKILNKLGIFFQQNNPSWVEVDFSEWSKTGKEKFNTIKEGILGRKRIYFQYFNSMSEMSWREVEPWQLWFKHKAWYLKAFCISKNAPRLFKLSRMRNVQLNGQPSINSPEVNSFPSENENSCIEPILIRLRVEETLAYRIYDEFEDNIIVKNDDGSFNVEMYALEDEWVYAYIMSFGPAAKVLEPLSFRESFIKYLKKTYQQY